MLSLLLRHQQGPGLGLEVSFEQQVNFLPQRGVSLARLLEESGASRIIWQRKNVLKEHFFWTAWRPVHNGAAAGALGSMSALASRQRMWTKRTSISLIRWSDGKSR